MIRPRVTYLAETISLTAREEKLKIFERRMIMWAKKVNENEYQPLIDHKIIRILRNESIVRIIKVNQMVWAYIQRRQDRATKSNK